jgi:hypothetical protein
MLIVTVLGTIVLEQRRKRAIRRTLERRRSSEVIQ